MRDKEDIPEWEKQAIIDDLIFQLLYREEFDKQKKLDKVHFSNNFRLNFEGKSHHGVHELKPAYQKLRAASESMFEFECMREEDNDLIPFPGADNDRIPVKSYIAGQSNGIHLLNRSLLLLLMKFIDYKYEFRTTEKGIGFFVKIPLNKSESI